MYFSSATYGWTWYFTPSRSYFCPESSHGNINTWHICLLDCLLEHFLFQRIIYWRGSFYQFNNTHICGAVFYLYSLTCHRLQRWFWHTDYTVLNSIWVTLSIGSELLHSTPQAGRHHIIICIFWRDHLIPSQFVSFLIIYFGALWEYDSSFTIWTVTHFSNILKSLVTYSFDPTSTETNCHTLNTKLYPTLLFK